MVFRTARVLRRLLKLASVGLVILTIVTTVVAQQLPDASKSPRELYAMTEEQTRAYVQAILSAGLPEAHSDELILLAMNRGQIVIPELVAAIKRVLAQAEPDERI